MEITKSAIRTYNLSKSFGNIHALRNLNIEIEPGEIFSLLGTNGAGKTTTIKLLCCLLHPTSGSASIMDYQINEDPAKIKEIIGVSPQETAIAEHLNTLENLLLMGGVYGMSGTESKNRARSLMKLIELENRKDQVRKLSGGLQRRLSLAMALMPDPQVLFLDEPTLGLDPHARKSVWDYIEKLKGDKTIFLTTHYLEEADALADHIAIIDNGEIIEKGTSYELKRRHKTSQILNISAEHISSDLIENLKNNGIEIERTSNGIELKAKELDFYSIIDILRTENVKIDGIEMQEPTLDDVFIKLTGKHLDV
jgi:ABC-2 type transport system ATP-binding protein